VLDEVLPAGLLDAGTRVLVNPSGSFVSGGPAADTGLTGRKIIVDTYGGAAPHGGGAFSGKDPSEVDRSAAYAARWLAKNVVSAGIADRCLVQLAYAIGVAQPLSVVVNTFGTTPENDAVIARALERAVDLTPRGTRDRLGLDRPIYARTAAYGHFGRAPEPDGGFSWERTDLGESLLDELA
jgi:S-adenosylmethionine synthetase